MSEMKKKRRREDKEDLIKGGRQDIVEKENNVFLEEKKSNYSRFFFFFFLQTDKRNTNEDKEGKVLAYLADIFHSFLPSILHFLKEIQRHRKDEKRRLDDGASIKKGIGREGKRGEKGEGT